MFIGAGRGIGLAIAKWSRRRRKTSPSWHKTAEYTQCPARSTPPPRRSRASARRSDRRRRPATATLSRPRWPDRSRRTVRRHRHLRQQRLGDQSGPSRTSQKAFDLMNAIQGCAAAYAVSRAHPAPEEQRQSCTHAVPADQAGVEVAAPDRIYMMAKYGMSLCALGIAEGSGIRVSRPNTPLAAPPWWPPPPSRTCSAVTRRGVVTQNPRCTLMPRTPCSTSLRPPGHRPGLLRGRPGRHSPASPTSKHDDCAGLGTRRRPPGDSPNPPGYQRLAGTP